MDSNLHKPTLRVLDIIEAVVKSSDGLNLTKIAETTQCPKSTLLPILKTLCERNYLAFSPDTLIYTMGREIRFLSQMYDVNDTILDLIHEQMKKLSKECNQTCHLGVRSESEIIYLLKVTASSPIQLISSVGKHLPAYATALGKALLFDTPLKELERLFPGTLQRFTPKTVGNAKELYNNIHSDATFTFEREEITPHTSCVAIPIRQNGSIVAALSITYISFITTDEQVEHMKEVLRSSALIIERLIKNRGFTY